MQVGSRNDDVNSINEDSTDVIYMNGDNVSRFIGSAGAKAIGNSGSVRCDIGRLVPNEATLRSFWFDVRTTNVLELHEILAGGEPGVTHEVIVRSKSMADWLEGRNAFVASKAFQEFVASTRPYSEVLHVLSGSPVQFYNAN